MLRDLQGTPSIRSRALLGLALLLASCGPVATVVDGDTLIIGRTHYRLWGISVPDLHETCAEAWPAGEAARRKLDSLTAERPVLCEARGLDPYRRVLATCRVDGRDLAAELVAAGLAWADTGTTTAYAGIEQDARRANRGIHAYDCRLVR